ncbi:hypothetical protein EJ04DRAFT_285392 [Polyplosphaeria fusca]|uniref:RING-type domain-containing protein n=1 Tax=Polyplosphaeria fusca TaxID=682080 RepID=A0A9P4RAD2_9PLEO|nr:hypothetical protein EJ04DRAFT_285392 [Polyplosphaeria fusca]
MSSLVMAHRLVRIFSTTDRHRAQQEARLARRRALWSQRLEVFLQDETTEFFLHPDSSEFNEDCPICCEPLSPLTWDPLRELPDRSPEGSMQQRTECSAATPTEPPCRKYHNRTVLQIGLCLHMFHYRCLLTWLSRKRVCPLCRRVLFYVNPNTEVSQEPGPPAAESSNAALEHASQAEAVPRTEPVVGNESTIPPLVDEGRGDRAQFYIPDRSAMRNAESETRRAGTRRRSIGILRLSRFFGS